MSEEALNTLRQKGLTLATNMEPVKQMQDVAEGMFQQPTEYMAMLWRIEQNAYAIAPTLDEYLKMCAEEKNSQMSYEDKAETLVCRWNSGHF